MTDYNPHCRKNAFKWNEEAVSVLKALYVTESMSAQIVSEKMSAQFKARISRQAVIGKLHQLNITRGQPLVSKPNPNHANRKKRAGPATPKVVVSSVTGAAVRTGQPKAGYLPPEPVVPGVRKVTLMMLKPGDCRWPVTASAPHFFCGLRVDGDHHYCAAHREAAKPKDPAKAQADIEKAAKYA